MRGSRRPSAGATGRARSASEPAGLALRTEGAFRSAEPDTAAQIADLLRVHVPDGAGRRLVGRGAAGPPDRIARPASSRATWSRSSGRRSPSATWATRPAPTWAWAPAGSRTTRRSPRTSPRRARRARSPTTRTRRGAMPRSPGSGSAGRSGRRRSTPPRTRCPSAMPRTRPASSGRSRSRPRRSWSRRSPDGPLLIAYGSPGAAAERQQDRFLVGLLGAVLAIGSAMVFAVMLDGGFGS